MGESKFLLHEQMPNAHTEDQDTGAFREDHNLRSGWVTQQSHMSFYRSTIHLNAVNGFLTHIFWTTHEAPIHTCLQQHRHLPIAPMTGQTTTRARRPQRPTRNAPKSILPADKGIWAYLLK